MLASVASTLNYAHAAMCSVKGGTLTFTGGSAVAAFQSAATLGAVITSGGQTVNLGLTLTVLRSAFATIPKRGQTASYSETTGAVTTTRSLKLDEITESDVFYTLTFVDPRA